MRNNKMKGFTLVELLVVIAILAILATVSVVGYTSYIEGATVRVDEDLAAQLTRFLEAYKVNNPGEITEDNIWQITQDVLEESGINDLEPKAAQYGYHFYFKFDGQGGGEYVAADENTLRISAFTRVVRFFANANTPKSNYAGIFYDEPGNKYFLCDTKGSPIAEAIKGFHTFKDIDGTTSAEQFANFKTLVMDLNQELYGDLKKLAESGVFVTKEGNFAFNRNAEHSNLFFHDEATFVGNTIKDAENELPLAADKPLLTVKEATTINIPKGVKLPANSLNIANEGQKATVVINAKSWDEVVDIVDAYFTDDKVVVELAGVKYEIYGNDVCAYTADGTKGEVVYVLKYNNSLQDFDIEILDNEDNQLLNGTKLVGEETIKAGFAAWDKGSFKLQLANATGKNDSAISSLDVEWKVISGPATISQDGTLTFTGNYDLSYDKVVVSATATIDRNGYASTNEKFDENNVAYNEYVIYISGPQGYTISAGGNVWAPEDASLTNREYNITLVQTVEGSEPFAFKCDISSRNLVEGVTPNYSDVTITYACTCGDHVCGTSCAKENCEHKDFTPEFSEGTVTTHGKCSGVIVVSYANYFTYTVNFSVEDATNFYVKPKNSGIYLGNLNKITMGDLFETADGGAFPAGAELRVYHSVPKNENGSIIDDYMDPKNRGAMFLDKDYGVNGVTCTVDKNVAGINETIRFTGTRTGDIYFAVFHNGVRISGDVIATEIVEAYNISKYDDIAIAENNSYSMALLNDIQVPHKEIVHETINVSAGKTLYGNFYTIFLPNPTVTTPETNTNQRTYSYIALNAATMRDTRVIGKIYPTLSLSAQADDGYGTNAVFATAGSHINNCYIANTRSPLVAGTENVDGEVVLQNTVLFGGRYCNIDFRGGTIKIVEDVITINQPHNDGTAKDQNGNLIEVVGTGINLWFNMNKNHDITKIDMTDGNLTQYNFISQNHTNYLDNVKIDLSGYNIPLFEELDIPLPEMFEGLFTTTGGSAGRYFCTRHGFAECPQEGNTSVCCSKEVGEKEGTLGLSKHKHGKNCVLRYPKYGDYIFYDDNGTAYVNTALISLSFDLNTETLKGIDGITGLIKFIAQLGDNLDSIIKNYPIIYIPNLPQNYDTTVYTYKLLSVLPYELYVHTIKSIKDDNGDYVVKDLFDGSFAATDIYCPWDVDLDDSDNEIDYPEYDFIDGEIIR